MAVTWWEILGGLAYTGCGLVCARLVAGHVAYALAASYSRNSPDGEQWFGASVCGTVAGIVWPLTFFVWRVHAGSEHWAVGAEAAAIRRQQAERIRELEREAGIR